MSITIESPLLAQPGVISAEFLRQPTDEGLRTSELAICAAHAVHCNMQSALSAAEQIAGPDNARQLLDATIAKLDALRMEELVLATEVSVMSSAGQYSDFTDKRDAIVATLEGDATGALPVVKDGVAHNGEGYKARLIKEQRDAVLEVRENPVELTNEECQVAIAGLQVSLIAEQAEPDAPKFIHDLFIGSMHFVASRTASLAIAAA